MQKILSICISLILYFNSISQINKDSLWSIWINDNLPDTIRLNAIDEIIKKGYLYTQQDSAYYYAQLQYDFAESKNQTNWMAIALKTQGSAYFLQNKIAKSLDCFNHSLILFEKCNDEKGMANIYNNMGLIYSNYSDYNKSIFYYKKSLQLKIAINDSNGIAKTYNNIGNVYDIWGNYEEAMEYFKEAQEINLKLNNQIGLTSSYINIGNIHYATKNYEKALDYYIKNTELNKKLNNTSRLAGVYNNIGLTYLKLKEYDKSLHYFQSSLEIFKNIKSDNNFSLSYDNLAKVYMELGEYKKALSYSIKAVELTKNSKLFYKLQEYSLTLYKIYKRLGQYDKALKIHELYTNTTIQLNEQNNKEELIKLESKRRYEKKYLSDSIKHQNEIIVHKAQNKAKEEELKRKDEEKLFLYTGIGFLVIFSLFIFNRFRITNKQKKIIEYQKEQVNQTNKEILDSIKYAKRLQDAILPPIKLIKNSLPNSFILFKPKSIVAGDFYWMEVANDHIYFAVADCTGHGVPGAIVSVVCSNALSKALIEEKKSSPAEILNKTRELVIERFEKSEKKINDGMDISICKLNSSNRKMEWAGANNPILIIRNGADETEIILPDNQPIGRYDNNELFTNHEIELNKGDSLYVYSDGFVDQFGGMRGKKYKANKFNEFLLTIQDKDMDTQCVLLNDEFNLWKGDFEQIDDVCVMGVKV